jgi:hypothetical protein
MPRQTSAAQPPLRARRRSSMVCNSALPKGHPQQHVENLDRANFIRSACPGMDLISVSCSLHEPLKMTLPAALRLVQIRLRRHRNCLVQFKIARDGPRYPPSYVARWDVVVSSGSHDAAPAATADIRATYWIGMTYS